MNIDDTLRRALRPKPAPPGFAEQVLERIHARPTRRRGARWLAAAAAIALLAAGGARYYAQQQAAAEAARVTREIRVALQITSETLARVQRRIDASVQPSQP
jgi:hypothetical protein